MLDIIRKDMIQSLKDGKSIKRQILSVVLSEANAIKLREGSISEDKIQKIIRKLITSNEEMFEASKDDKYIKENDVLNEYLPKLWTIEQIDSFFQNNTDILEEIRECKHQGKATGMAIKFLKSNKAPVDGKDVVEWIKGI